ncbi:helix-turn-helix transcriptional regulator [Streptomyces zhihengii]|uniref:Helix-turn-helix domain-containing protein n=1 Tax=Streptomyces zhihengii TaxID=1818004 RepID=A0ABS2UWE9_9ACTN|nr:helix-turn-helix domain-containing protein [Streptomyces zhihengii]MBM9621799.1 helix-turn-helix domain-containing protein [Streptomyces zhihengii]
MSEKIARQAVDKAKADGVLTTRQVAEEYGFAPQTLANWRWKGEGPSFIRIGNGVGAQVRYRRSAVETWLDKHTVQTGGAAA